MVDVLYIAGEGRSGSTILGNVLGESQHFFHAGEVRYLWEKGLTEDRLCGCGARFSVCGFWKGVASRVSATTAVDVPAMLQVDKELAAFRRRHEDQIFSSSMRNTREFETYCGNLLRLYTVVSEACGGRVVVDSSKSPYYLYALSRTGGVRLRVVHLVRDPRAVAFSLRRKRARPDAGDHGQMNRFRADRSARRWNRLNRAVEAVASRVAETRIVVRYEDFCSDPRASFRRIHALIGAEAASDIFRGERSIELTENHGIWGNPSRFEKGHVELRVDDEWRRRMPLAERVLVSVLTARTRKRYGY